MTELDPVELLRREAERQEAIRAVFKEELQKQMAQQNQVLAHYTRMGKNVSYICTQPLSWVAQHVGFAHDLPVFRQQLSEDGRRLQADPSNIKKLRQRPINYSRQFDMAQYLLRANHKFAPLLLVLHDSWVDDVDSDNWTDGRAVRDAARFEPLDEDGNFGRLYIDGSSQQLYALDGQHRLNAIKGAMKIANGLPLHELNGEGREIGRVCTKADLEDSAPEFYSPQFFREFASERIGLEIISAVNRGESYAEASRRVRTIFVEVNKMAQTVPKGSQAALDDNLGFTIVAQECLGHPALQGFGSDDETGKTRTLVGMEKPNLSARSDDVTTLDSLAQCARFFLSGEEIYERWMPENANITPIRPSDDEIAAAVKDFGRFLDLLKDTRVFEQTAAGTPASDLREFSREDGPKSLLLRPAMQQMIAKAVGEIYYQAGVSWDQIASRFRDLEKRGIFDNGDQDSSYWRGLQVKIDTGRMQKSPKPITARLLKYLLAGTAAENSMEELREACQMARTVTGRAPGESSRTLDWDGSWTNEEIQLPPLHH